MALLTPPQWGMEDAGMSTEQWQSGPSEQSPAQHWLEGTWTEGTLAASTPWLCCGAFEGQLRLSLHMEPEQHPGTDGLCSET